MKHERDVEEYKYGSHRRGIPWPFRRSHGNREVEQGSRDDQRDRERDYSKEARYDDSKTSERIRYINVKGNDDHSRCRH